MDFEAAFIKEFGTIVPRNTKEGLQMDFVAKMAGETERKGLARGTDACGLFPFCPRAMQSKVCRNPTLFAFRHILT